MLSFLRDQGGTDSSSKKPDVPAGKTSADGVEPPQEEKYITIAAKRTRMSTILLAVLFIAGLLCLWFMIKKSMPTAAVATTTDTEEVQIEAALGRLTGVKSEMFSRMDEIVKKFYEFSNVLQIQVSELAKDPFSIDYSMIGGKKESEVVETPKIDAALEWRQDIERKAQGMQLLSIVQSDQGKCCMITDKILSTGDSIQGFKVRQIGEDFVKLQWAPEHDDRPAGTESERIEIVLELPK